MRILQRDRFSPRRLAWLLALVLLLPLAQTVASWHLLSHVHAEQPSDSQHAIHIDHCDLCLTAVALTGGALAAQSMTLAPSVAPEKTPRAPSRPVWLARLYRSYESRAPPSALI